MNAKRYTLWIVTFLTPVILLFLFFYAYPIITIGITAFTHWKLGEAITFAGTDNFTKMIKDPVFIQSFVNTLKWLVLHWSVLVGIGLLTALLTMKKSKVSTFVKACYLIPNMIPLAVIGFLFYFIFNPSIGLANNFIRLFGADNFSLNWFQDNSAAFFTVTVTTIFYGGVFTLLMSSEIAAVPEEIYESAKIDGANDLQINLYIVLPLIRNIIGTALILATVQCLKTFEVIYLTTSGGPGNLTMNLPILIFRTAMNNSNYGYSNAISFVTIILGAISIGIISKLFKIGKTDY